MALNKEQEMIISESEQETIDGAYEATGTLSGGMEISVTLSEEEEADCSSDMDVAYHEVSVRCAFESMAEGVLIHDSLMLTSINGITKEEFLEAE